MEAKMLGRENGPRNRWGPLALVLLVFLLLFGSSQTSADANQCSQTACTNNNQNNCNGDVLVIDFWANNPINNAPTTDANGLIQMVPDQCQSGFHAFDGRCYSYSLGLFGVPVANGGLGEPPESTWDQAEAICSQSKYSADAAFGGCHLVSIHTMRENCYLHEIIPGNSYFHNQQPRSGYSAYLIKDKRSRNDYNGCHSSNLGGGGSAEARGTCWIGLDQKSGTEGIAYGWNDLTKYDRRPRRNGGFTPWAGGGDSARECFSESLGDMISTGCCNQWGDCNWFTCSGTCKYYEPNNIYGGTEDCTQLWDRDGTQGEWNDEPCSYKYPYFCAKLARCRAGFYRSVLYKGMPVRANPNIQDHGVDKSYSKGLCSQCPPGKWHAQDSVSNYEADCSFCDAGRYGVAGETTRTCTATCPAGSYCPVGTGVNAIPPCPAGTYNSLPGQISDAACVPVPPGYYSLSKASGYLTTKCNAGRCGYERASSAQCQDPCPAGHSCSTGTGCFNQTTIPEKLPSPCGGNDKYAPAGSASCISVPTGFYSFGGTSTTRSGVAPCPPGSYCQNGVQLQCSEGKYNNLQGSSSPADCKTCQAGYYCPKASTSPTQESCFLSHPDPNLETDKPKMYYCPAGTTTRLLVSNNFYTIPATEAATNTRSGQVACNTTQVCVDGEAFDKITFSSTSCATLAVDENNLGTATNRTILGQLNSALAGKGYSISYGLEDFSLASDLVASLGGGPCDPKANAAPYSNAEIFLVDGLSGEVKLSRAGFPTYLNYEPTNAAGDKCPITGVRYDLKVSATATGESTTTKITCTIPVVVNDQNDTPYFENEMGLPVYYRSVPEKSLVNTPVGRCDAAAHLIYGCPVNHDESFSIEIQAQDEDYFSIKRYSFVMGRGSAENWTDANNPFHINSCSGLITMKGNREVSYLNTKTFNLTIRVEDDGNGGLFQPLSAEVIVIIFITDAPDPPVLIDPSFYDFTVYENMFEDQLIGHVNATDPDVGAVVSYRLVLPVDGDAFYMDSAFNIRTTLTGSKNIDFESTKKTYIINVEAYDCTPVCPGLSDIKSYTIRVLNTNDPPRFQDVSSFYLKENSNDSSPVCFDSSGVCPTPGPLDRVKTVDVDGGGADQTVYSLVNASNIFEIDAASGTIRTTTGAKQFLNFEDETLSDQSGTGRSFRVNVRATSLGLNSDSASSDQVYVIYLVDENEQPTITRIPEFYVLETAPVGSYADPTNVSMLTLQATDPDNADLFLKGALAPVQTVLFSRVDGVNHATNSDGGSLFSVVNLATGGAAIRTTGSIDFETAPGGAACGSGGGRCYIIRVRATDNGPPPSRFDEAWVTIHVVDVNDGPSFSAPLTRSFSVSENVTSASIQVSPGTYTASDGDTADPLEYSIDGGSGADYFAVESACSGTCFSVVKKAGITFDFESSKTLFTLIVQVTDNKRSKFIGQGCGLVNGIPAGCDAGTRCAQKVGPYQNEYRCYEYCPPTTDGVEVIPRRDTFFCDYAAIPSGTKTPNETLYDQVADNPLRLNIDITDWNDPPYIVSQDGSSGDEVTCLINTTISVTKQSTDQIAVAALKATDVDVRYAAAPFTYVEDDPNDPFWQLFDIDSQTGKIGIYPIIVGGVNNKSLNLGDHHTARVRVLDEFPHDPYAPQMSSTCTIVVVVGESNERPDLVDPAPEFLAEGSPSGTNVSLVAPNLTAVDLDVSFDPPDVLTFSMSESPYFSLNSSTSLITLQGTPLDYEELAAVGFKHTLVVRVQDRKGAQDVAVVTVNVLDVNEAPRWTAPTLSRTVLENATALSTVVDLKTLAVDPDRYADGHTVFNNTKFSILSGCDATCPFELTSPSTSGFVRVKAGTVLDFEGAVKSWAIVIRATDGGDDLLFNDATITLNLADVNERPSIVNGVQLSVPEGSAGQFLTNLNSLIADPDASDPISMLKINITAGDPQGVFVIDQGRLFVSATGVLDYEDTRSYTLNITVTDTGGLSSTGSFFVNVTNVNDVTVTGVSLLTGNGLLDCSSVSRVRITGTNFGLVSRSPPANVTVRFRRPVDSSKDSSPPIRLAQGCSVVTGNTIIECDIPATAGMNYLFDVFISVPSTVINGDNFQGFTTSIRSEVPSISGVTGVSALPTAGGSTSVDLTGTCFGTPGDSVVLGNSLTSSFSSLEFCDFSTCVPLTGCAVVSSTLVRCTNAIPAGLGNSLKWKLRILNQLQTDYFIQGAYAAPSLLTMNNLTLPTSGNPGGSPFFVLTGSNFGPLGSIPQFAYFTYLTNTYNFRECQVTVAFTTVVCKSSDPGVGINMKAFISFGNQLSAPSPFTLNFAAPSVTLLSGQGAVEASTIGGQFVTVTGRNFGGVCGLPGASIEAGGVDCQFVSATYSKGSVSTSTGLPISYTAFPCAVMSQTQIVCATAPGTGAGHAWTVFVGGQRATMEATAGTTSYGSPVVATYDGIGATHAETNGGQSINIQGSNFGPEGGALVTARYGNKDINPTEFAAASCNVTRAHTQITCTTSPGAGNELSWVVTVDDQLGRNELTNYAPPALSSTNFVSPFLNNDGGNVFTVNGTNFGPPGAPGPYLESASFGPPSFPAAYPVACTVTSHTTMSCTMGAGAGTGMVMVVTVKGQTSVNSPFTLSYRPPDLSGGILPENAEKRTEGGATLFIRGSGFSLCDPKAFIKIIWQEDPLILGATNRILDITSFWNAEGTVQSPTCPIGTEARIGFVVPEMNVARSVRVSLQVSSTASSAVIPSPGFVTFTYDKPLLTSIFAEASAVNFGGVRVSIFGNNFCNAETCCRTHLDGTPVSIENIVSHSHNKIVLEVIIPGSLFVRCGTVSSNALSFSTNSPFVFGTVPQLNQKDFKTAGNETLEIWGLYFGDTAPNVTIGDEQVEIAAHAMVDCYDSGRPSTADSFAFDSGAQCYKTTVRTPARTGRNLPVVIVRGSTKSLADDVRFEFLNFMRPDVVTATGIPALEIAMTSSGGKELTLTGTNFGVQQGEIWIGQMDHDPILCNITSWADSSVKCIIGTGDGANLPISIIQAAGIQTEAPPQFKLTYLPPSALDFDGAVLHSTTGGSLFELTGQNFGRPNKSVITVGGVVCPLIFSDANHAICSFPEGEGSNMPVILSVGGQSATATKRASYAPPVITDITPSSNLPTAGGLLFRVTGENFGVNNLRLMFDSIIVAERFLDPDPLLHKNPFIYPGTNHTQLLLFLPEFFGSNRTVTVYVKGQLSAPSINISFALPVIGNVTVINEDGSRSSPFSTSEDLVFPVAAFNGSAPGFSPSSGRRLFRSRRRQLATAGYGMWSSTAFGPCESSVKAKALFWRQFNQIAPNGDFRRTFNHFAEGTCSSAINQTFVVDVEGTLTDLGPLSPDVPTAACGLSRVFSEFTSTVTVTVLTSLGLQQVLSQCGCASGWSIGSPLAVPQTCLSSAKECPLFAATYGAEYPPGVTRYGVYVISNDVDIFLSTTVKSLDDLATKSSLKFPDTATASVSADVRNLVSLSPKGPTDGCFVWEPIRSFLERAEAISKATGVPITDVPRECFQRALLEISGSNFGAPLTAAQRASIVGSNELPSLRVFLVPDNSSIEPFEASTVASPGSHRVLCPAPDCFQTHNKIRFWVPYGLGKSLRIRVHVGDQAQYATTRFSYLPPRIEELNPGTVRLGRNFQDARGETVVVRGHNFGGRATKSAVLINGRPCTNPTWDSGALADTDGRPFITCDASLDVVGPKSVMICVAGQLSFERVYRTDGPVLLAGESLSAWNASRAFIQSFSSQLRSLSLSRCPAGSTGRLYELCIDCPRGAQCEDGSFSGPKSDEFFFDYRIPVHDSDGNITDRAKALCAKESWNTSFLEEYPDLVQRETCNAFVGCEPKTACIGNSACNTGYEYSMPRCLDKRGYGTQAAFLNLSRANVEGTANACNVSLNPYTFEFEGKDSDCRGEFADTETCTSDHPENCAKCTVFKDGDNSYFGACECTLPQRCSLCTIGTHYRMNNECIPCPENPGLLIGGLFAIAFVVALLGWYLQREQVNLAFITIGIDYFQVLAIFAATKVPWPPALLALFNIMSVFNFNIDITAPECLVPNLDYEVKWWLQMALPLALFTILALIYFGYAGIKMARWGMWQAHVYQSHLSALIAIFMIAMYYLYLVLTKKALEVFNCNPVDPDDGFLYTAFTSLKCDGGGLCRCGEPNGPQERLVPFAILFLVLYTFGYPAYIAMTLRRNSLLVREDQYLRAYEVGYVRKTNPDCYDMRKRYAKLYYQFKPRYASFWILVLLIRKFWIAFAFILFRGNPSFQLAVVLLVLFTSIVFQVLWRPYLSTRDRPAIVRELDAMAERSIKEPAFAEYREIQKRVQDCMTLDVEHRRRIKQTKQGAQLFSGMVQDSGKNLGLALSKKEKVSVSVAAARWFTNLNTLEFILLGCGIIVCLGGIMFEASARDNRALVRAQVEGITYIVLITIVVSFIYYFLFFLGEASPKCISSLLALCRKKNKDEDNDEYYDPNINLEENPMFAAPKVEFADNRALQAELDQQLSQLKLAEQQNRRLRDELKNKKMEAQLDETARQQNTGLEEVRPQKQRKDFAQTRLTAALVGPNRQRARGGNKKVMGEDEEDDDVEASPRPKSVFSRLSIAWSKPPKNVEPTEEDEK